MASKIASLAWLSAGSMVLVSACGLDFSKFAAEGGGDGSAAEQDGASDGSVSIDTGMASGSDTGADVALDVAVDVALDVGTDASEPPEASVPDASDAGVTDYTVGGTLSGLIGNGLQLANAGNTLSPVSGATKFTFPAQPNGSAYAVTVKKQPAMPSQTCAVTNGSGNVAGANVGNVMVTCTPSCAPDCLAGQMCIDGTDCASQVCTTGHCAAPACAPNCGPGAPCGANTDCKTGQCKGNHTCR